MFTYTPRHRRLTAGGSDDVHGKHGQHDEGSIRVWIPPQAKNELFAHHVWNAGLTMVRSVCALLKSATSELIGLCRNAHTQADLIVGRGGLVDVRGKNVIELGAGAGIPGLVAAREGANLVRAFPCQSCRGTGRRELTRTWSCGAFRSYCRTTTSRACWTTSKRTSRALWPRTFDTGCTSPDTRGAGRCQDCSLLCDRARRGTREEKPTRVTTLSCWPIVSGTGTRTTRCSAQSRVCSGEEQANILAIHRTS